MLSSSFEETLQICSYNSCYEGGKKVKSIIEETGVESIETQDNGIVKITSKDLSSLEKSKAIISNLTMVPTVGDIYRNCEIKSIAPYGVFAEISPGREGLCHISELSTSWLAKAEVINGKGQLRLSRRALLSDSNTENSGTKQHTVDLSEDLSESTEKGKQNSVTRAVEVEIAELSNEISVDIEVRRSSKSKPVVANTLMEDKFVKKLVSSGKKMHLNLTETGQRKAVINLPSVFPARMKS